MTEPDNLPPHSIEDERMFLSCCIQDREQFLEYSGRVVPAVFYDLRHAAIWQEMENIEAAGEGISGADLAMKFKGELRSYCFETADAAPSAANAPSYHSRINELWQKRQVLKGCAEVEGMARNGHSLPEIAEAAERLLAVDIKAPPLLGGKECARRNLADLEERFARGGKLTGLPTGFHDLDEITDGWQNGEMVVIGARPSIGKTAIGLQFFCEAVFRGGIPSLFYSLEMSTEALMRRMVGMEKKISLKTLRKGQMTDKEMQWIATFHAQCLKAPMHIIDSTQPGIAEVCATIRRAHRKHGVKLVVVDYLQKIRASEKNEKRTYEIGEVSGRLKDVAKKLGIVIIALAQLNRESEKDKGRAPRLSDLADSGQIERDADFVGLLHRDRSEPVGPASFIVAKQRDGETGMVPLTFLGYFGRFESRTDDRQTSTPYPADDE